ncbi:MAG: N-acetylmuramic acid 6-phosphate etherase [Arachnia sp.]
MTSHQLSSGDLQALTTETVDPRYRELDLMTTAQMVAAMNDAEAEVPRAVKRAMREIVSAVDAISSGLARGGRLIYVGAGTAGRLGVLDASECPPTFSTPAEMVHGIIAGGHTALTTAVEGAEDDLEAGFSEIMALNVTEIDTVVGISASGRTPFVMGAITAATSCGATTAGLSCNAGAPLSALVSHPIEVVVGPEVLTGSTRLKAGSAQKQVLNMLSTLPMVRIGKTYGNLMVDVAATNLKLEVRALNLVVNITGATPERAAEALSASGGDVKTAVVCVKRDLDPGQASALLASHAGNLRAVIEG